ncbi:MAG: alginate lyase family protein, partial [Pseudomonadota bacterium]
QEGALAECGWDNPDLDKLWRYNQHYFDDLNATTASDRFPWQIALLDDWIAQNPPGQGSGWEPYPASLRIVNWIKWALGGNALRAEWAHSLVVQTRWLKRRLEWHLLGNHLFANAKALIFAGLFFEGPEAQRWLTLGTRILIEQLPEQILADGAQFELSPMYHALALEDVLDLINVFAAFEDVLQAPQHALRDACRSYVQGMRSWLDNMSHPDGRISFFNDAAFGVAPENVELHDYAARLDFSPIDAARSWHGESGYARLTAGEAVLILDMAAVGPDYLPGHAHADTLSFEFSLGNQRIFVNSGTSVYGIGPERSRQRGTAAHNCVVIDDMDSSDVWGGFRVGRRARVSGAAVRTAGEVLEARAQHDGYRRLTARPVHDRHWQLTAEHLAITDATPRETPRAQARYHLHPSIKTAQHSPKTGLLLCPDGREIGWASNSSVTIEQSTWHPEFGISEPATCLVIAFEGHEARLQIEW